MRHRARRFSSTSSRSVSRIREPNGTITAIRTGTTSHYVIADRQNSVIRLVDAAGAPQNSYSYDPYGTSRAKTEPVANPCQYIGAPLDTNGLYHLHNRYYDPSIGRFTQPDPSSQESNTYLYSTANPTNASDPTGLWWGEGVARSVWNGFGRHYVAGQSGVTVFLVGVNVGVFGGFAAGGPVGALAGGIGLGGAAAYGGYRLPQYLVNQLYWDD